MSKLPFTFAFKSDRLLGRCLSRVSHETAPVDYVRAVAGRIERVDEGHHVGVRRRTGQRRPAGRGEDAENIYRRVGALFAPGDAARALPARARIARDVQ